MRLQVRGVARGEQLVYRIGVCHLVKTLDFTDLEIAGIALVFDDVFLRAIRQRNHAAVRILDMQIATKRDDGDHVEIAQMINQTVQPVSRHGLVKKDLIGLSVNHMRAIKGN